MTHVGDCSESFIFLSLVKAVGAVSLRKHDISNGKDTLQIPRNPSDARQAFSCRGVACGKP